MGNVVRRVLRGVLVAFVFTGCILIVALQHPQRAFAQLCTCSGNGDLMLCDNSDSTCSITFDLSSSSPVIQWNQDLGGFEATAPWVYEHGEFTMREIHHPNFSDPLYAEKWLPGHLTYQAYAMAGWEVVTDQPNTTETDHAIWIATPLGQGEAHSVWLGNYDHPGWSVYLNADVYYWADDNLTACANSQGNCMLAKTMNIATSGSTDQAFTLPYAYRTGEIVYFVNRTANNLHLYPAHGDDLGNGTSCPGCELDVASNHVVQCHAVAAGTTWFCSVAQGA